MIGIIVAVPAKHGPTLESLSGGVIGKDGGLPWRHKGDLKRFKEVTDAAVVLMGRKTWESIGSAPLPGRLNGIVSETMLQRQSPHEPGARTFATFENAYRWATDMAADRPNPDVWIIGGAGVYAPALEVADLIDVTFVPDEGVEGDVRFPDVDELRWRPDGPFEPLEHPYNPALRVGRWRRWL